MLLSPEPRELGVPKGIGILPLRLRIKSSALGAAIAWFLLAWAFDIDPGFDPAADRFREVAVGREMRACSSLSGS